MRLEIPKRGFRNPESVECGSNLLCLLSEGGDRDESLQRFLKERRGSVVTVRSVAPEDALHPIRQIGSLVFKAPREARGYLTPAIDKSLTTDYDLFIAARMEPQRGDLGRRFFAINPLDEQGQPLVELAIDRMPIRPSRYA